ncbi:16S rRNA (guanine(966)-N(2))-methyltransferase RsmD [Phragmitibacter flavus]|uniref:16S rRNA (Guanine(966)-N(2))-methyltransferase RsmD n=1 Tax=Phragmitibacter flavus TaxID=2576071 RepID=A0A5R8K985_9BACT|nr:16S rRNA (guanine(966)-N(2))-methyltransferase RsmD [Phragmitibacter flavus]TLD68495.1 16S rRNA (guanine(966)-N(2))-methyltransferase RsmD [Phragmitibacter flavus]
MRIISGSAGGIPIKVPPLVARPTTDRVREALFSMLGGSCEDLKVLDLFAGSGALGLEALSRGAKEARFVEQHGGAAGIISENLLKTRLQGGQVMKAEVFATLRRLAQEGSTFDLVFADPPYAKLPGEVNLAETLLANEDLRSLLAGGGSFVLECMATKKPLAGIEHWQVVRDRVYGSTRILILTLHLILPTATDPDGEIPSAADL